MRLREQQCVVDLKDVPVLMTWDEALGRGDPGSTILAEEAFVVSGCYDRKVLARQLTSVGLPRLPTRLSVDRRETWNALVQRLEGVAEVPKRPKQTNDAEQVLPEKGAAPRRKNTRTPMTCLIYLTTTKPKRKKGPALRRYNCYRDGMTVQEYVDAGGIPWDVWYDTLYGYIELRNPDGTPFQRPDHVA